MQFRSEYQNSGFETYRGTSPAPLPTNVFVEMGLPTEEIHGAVLPVPEAAFTKVSNFPALVNAQSL